jgi:hypothetical protein
MNCKCYLSKKKDSLGVINVAVCELDGLLLIHKRKPSSRGELTRSLNDWLEGGEMQQNVGKIQFHLPQFWKRNDSERKKITGTCYGKLPHNAKKINIDLGQPGPCNLPVVKPIT